MYIENKRECIDHHEEELLMQVYQDVKDPPYPELNRIWESFYDGPLIMPDVSKRVAKELIVLREEISLKKEFKYLLVTIDRLVPFFEESARRRITIKCVSD